MAQSPHWGEIDNICIFYWKCSTEDDPSWNPLSSLNSELHWFSNDPWWCYYSRQPSLDCLIFPRWKLSCIWFRTISRWSYVFSHILFTTSWTRATISSTFGSLVCLLCGEISSQGSTGKNSLSRSCRSPSYSTAAILYHFWLCYRISSCSPGPTAPLPLPSSGVPIVSWRADDSGSSQRDKPLQN